MKTPEVPAQGRDLRLVVGASAGGHANELLQLLSAAGGQWPLRPQAAVITMDITSAAFAPHVESIFVIGEANRHSPIAAVRMLWRAFKACRSTRPDVVVTTGSFPLAVFALLSRMLYSSRVIWIDSIAQMTTPSMSGRLVSRFADVCLTQWPMVAEQNPRFQYKGELF